MGAAAERGGSAPGPTPRSPHRGLGRQVLFLLLFKDPCCGLHAEQPDLLDAVGSAQWRPRLLPVGALGFQPVPRHS